MATWRELIFETLVENSDIDTYVTTLSEEELDIKFHSGYGIEEGLPFTAWTTNYVYFPISYDGSESVGYCPRNPNGVAMYHQGGG
jgi:hypothetical protein